MSDNQTPPNEWRQVKLSQIAEITMGQSPRSEFYEDIWASDCSFISREQSGAPYMWYIFLKINQENLYHMRHGAVQQHIYPSDIARLRICAPDKPQLWDELNRIITSLFERVGSISDETRLLKYIRDTALPQLLAGKADLSQTRTLENI